VKGTDMLRGLTLLLISSAYCASSSWTSAVDSMNTCMTIRTPPGLVDGGACLFLISYRAHDSFLVPQILDLFKSFIGGQKDHHTARHDPSKIGDNLSEF